MTDQDHSYEGHDLAALFALRNCQKWIAGHFAPYLSGHVAEFGAGIGAISQWLANHAERMDLIEPSGNLVTILTDRLGNRSNVSVFAETMQDYVARGSADTLNAAVLVNVLEHIDDDTVALIGLKRLLLPSGYLLIFVPAMPSLYSELDRLAGHFRRYSRKSLSAAVSAAGFDIVDLRYFDLLGILPWWLVNTVGGKTDFNPRLATLYDRLGVPVTRMIEAIFPPPLGKNLLLVAQRQVS